MRLLKTIDSLATKAELRMRKTPFYQPEITASAEVIAEHSERSREEIDEELTERELPSVMENGMAFVKSLPVLFPLAFGLAFLVNVRKILIRRQQR